MAFGDWAASALGSGYAKGAGQILQGDFKKGGGSLVQGFKDTATLGFSARDREKKKAEEDAKARADEIENGLRTRMDQSLNTQDKLNREKLAGTGAAFGKMNASDTNYNTRVSDLMKEAKTSSTDARNVYNSMSSQYGGMQEAANSEANKAMGLDEYGNVNNKIQTDTRNLYNAEGDRAQGDYNAEGDDLRNTYNAEGQTQQGMYEGQATGETRRGQADYGVLSALGAKSAGLGMTGPMTVGQQMAMMAQSQGQAGEAYAATQRRVQNLRDQGLQANTSNRDRGLELRSNARAKGLDTKTSTRNQGISAGFDRNDALYAAGQGAKDRQEGLMRDRNGFERGFRDYEINSRGEREGLSQNLNAGEQRINQRDLGLVNMKSAQGFEMERARVAEEMRRAGKSQADIQQALASMQAQSNAYGQAVGGVVSTAGTVAGGIVGGPAGAAAGNAAGKAVSAGSQEAPTAQPAAQPAAAPTAMNFTGQPTAGAPSSFDQYLTRKYSQNKRVA